MTSIEERANVLLGAWLRGINEGEHCVTPADIAEVYRLALAHAESEASQ